MSKELTSHEVNELIKEGHRAAKDMKCPVYGLGSQDLKRFVFPGGVDCKIFVKKVSSDAEEFVDNAQALSLNKDLNGTHAFGDLISLNNDGKPFAIFLDEPLEYVKVKVETKFGVAFIYKLTDCQFLSEKFGASIDDIVLKSTLTFSCNMEVLDKE